jgi:hypothetical protein
MSELAEAGTTGDAARRQCLAALERRFGWLRLELARAGGNLSALPRHYQVLWYGRQRAVGRFNAAGQERDARRRESAYQRLAKELTR